MGTHSVRTDKSHSQKVKASTTPMKSKVTKTGKLQHPASGKPKAC